MLIIDENVFSNPEEFEFYGDSRDDELFAKVILLEDSISSDYLFDTLIDYAMESAILPYVEQQYEGNKVEIQRAYQVLEKLEGRYDEAIKESEDIMKPFVDFFDSCIDYGKTLVSLMKEVAVTFYNVSAAALTFDFKKFVKSLVSGIKGISKKVFDATLGALSLMWEGMTTFMSGLARTLNATGLDFVGEGLISLVDKVNGLLDRICDDSFLKILDVALPIVTGIAAGIASGATAIPAGIKAGVTATSSLETYCMVAQVGAAMMTLQMNSFESELHKKSAKQVAKDIAATEDYISVLEEQAITLKDELEDQEERIENTKRRFNIVMASGNIFKALRYEYEGLSPETAIRVYFRGLGGSMLQDFITSDTATFNDIQDLLGVIYKLANREFSGVRKCPNLPPAILRFVNETTGTTPDRWCAFVSRTQVEQLTKEYEKEFPSNSIARSMKLKDFLKQYGDKLEALTHRIIKQKAYLYQNILEPDRFQEIYNLMKDYGLNADAIMLGITGEDDFSGKTSNNGKKFLYSALALGTAFCVYLLIKKRQKRLSYEKIS